MDLQLEAPVSAKNNPQETSRQEIIKNDEIAQETDELAQETDELAQETE
jgi:hypothetical protein